MGIRKVVSRDPWEMVRGRREADDLGVATPVWGPVPEPYILLMEKGGYQKDGLITVKRRLAVVRSRSGLAMFEKQSKQANSPIVADSNDSIKSRSLKNAEITTQELMGAWNEYRKCFLCRAGQG